MTSEFNSSTQCDDHVMTSILQAMQDTDEHALNLLNDKLANWPLDYRLWFLRGAVHAGQQRHGEARTDFVQAITLAPEFHVARFMLGLLELMNTRVAEATATWSLLDRLPENDPLRVLKEGLVSLSLDHFDLAHEQLNRGLALNQQYPLVNAYVRAVIGQIEARAKPDSSAASLTDSQVNHLLLSGYQGNQTRH